MQNAANSKLGRRYNLDAGVSFQSIQQVYRLAGLPARLCGGFVPSQRVRSSSLLVPLQLNPFTDEEAQCSLQLHKTSGYRTIILLERH